MSRRVDPVSADPCACCGGALDGATVLLGDGKRLHPQCDAYTRARHTTEADEREAWTRFAAGAAERWGARAETADIADALLAAWRQRWGAAAVPEHARRQR